MKANNPLIELADGDYELSKHEAGWSHRVTIPQIEKRWKLKPGQLINYRANHYSRNGGLSPRVKQTATD